MPARRISPASLATLREACPIDDVLRGLYGIELAPAGSGQFKVRCAFHNERTASLHVSVARGLYHCFGCNAGGDVIDFVRQADNLDFLPAVHKLAHHAGLTLPDLGPTSSVSPGQPPVARLAAANRAAADHYTAQLREPQAVRARQFLGERSLSAEALSRFELGYAPPGLDQLHRHLSKQGFSDAEQLAAGLVRTDPRRGPVDVFRDRLILPIHTVNGRIAGFAGRRLRSADAIAKYLNTATTPLYDKSRLLYGAHVAAPGIRASRELVIVEGYTDLLALHAAGITGAVATAGTAFTDGHLSAVRRLMAHPATTAVVFAFDGDRPGRQAAADIFRYDQRLPAPAYTVLFPTGTDPCELRATHGDAALLTALADRMPLVRHALTQALSGVDLDHPSARVRAVDTTAEILAAIDDPLLRHETANSAATWLAIDPQHVHEAITTHRSTRTSQNAPTPQEAEPATGLRWRTERQWLALAVQYPDLLAGRTGELAPTAFGEPVHRAVYAVLTAGGRDPAQPSRQNLLRDSLRGPAKDLLTELALTPIQTAPGQELAGLAAGLTLALHEHAALDRLEVARSWWRQIHPARPARRAEAAQQLVHAEVARRTFQPYTAAHPAQGVHL
jgi:DNA primase